MHVFKAVPLSHGWKIADIGLQFQFKENILLNNNMEMYSRRAILLKEQTI